MTVHSSRQSQRRNAPAILLLATLSVLAVVTASITATGNAANDSPAPGHRVSGASPTRTVQETNQLRYEPSRVSVDAGGVVAWDNTGSVQHNVTFDPYPAISSATMQPGDRHEVQFTTPGTFQYRCSFHPGMNGSVMVPAS